MTTLATSDLSTADIRSILSITATPSTVASMCASGNVDKYGLDPDYCDGADVDAMLATLQATPHDLGNFRGYRDDVEAYVAIEGPGNIARAVYGETLHSSLYWKMGLKHYSTSGLYGIGTKLRNWHIQFDDVAYYQASPLQSFGATNQNVYDYPSSSPGWSSRAVDRDYTPFTGTTTLPTGSYYFIFGVSTYWLAEPPLIRTKPLSIYIAVPCTLYDYILGDPDEFNVNSSAHSGQSFGVWTGVSSTTTVTSGSSWIFLTGSSTGTGNRTQTFDIDENFGTARSGTIRLTISGDTFDITINQAGV